MKTSTKRYKDVEVGDIVDGVKITDVEKDGQMRKLMEQMQRLTK